MRDSHVPGAPEAFSGRVEIDDVLATGPTDARGRSTAKALGSVFIGVVVGLFITAALARVLSAARGVRWLLQQANPVREGPAADSLRRWQSRDRGARRVDLLSSAQVDEPIALGLVRQRIVVPRMIESRLAGAELDAVLGHELAHILRGDTRWTCLAWIGATCLGFQPLNHVALRAWRRTAELCCDQWVVDNGADPLALARGLASVAALPRRDAPAEQFSTAATTGSSDLVDRVGRLLDIGGQRYRSQWTRHPRWGQAAIIMILAVAWLFVPGVHWGDRSTTASAPAAERADHAEPMVAVTMPREGNLQVDEDTGPVAEALSELQRAVDQLVEKEESLRWQVESLDERFAQRESDTDRGVQAERREVIDALRARVREVVAQRQRFSRLLAELERRLQQ